MSSVARSPKQLGALIQQLRKARGWSQTDLAERASLRQEMVSKIEGGHPGTRIASVWNLLAALNLEMTVAPRTVSSAADIEDIF